jgi:CheY-like chemotaxis protein
MKTILVAEDRDASRELLQAVLTTAGYRVLTAVDGRDALATAATHPFDLAIVDLNMPHMDGVGVLQCLKENPQFAAVPVVALTAHAMDGDRERALAMGFSEYITKPVNLSLLRRELARLLEAVPEPADPEPKP